MQGKKTLDVASVFFYRVCALVESIVIRITGRRQRMYARAALVALILGQARQAAATACATYPCSCADHPCACIREGASPDGEESGKPPGGLAPHLNAERCAARGGDWTFCGGCGGPQTPKPTPQPTPKPTPAPTLAPTSCSYAELQKLVAEMKIEEEILFRFIEQGRSIALIQRQLERFKKARQKFIDRQEHCGVDSLDR